MKISIIPGAKARVLARMAKLSEEQEKDVLEMLHSLKDGDGAEICVEEGEGLSNVKNLIRSIAKIEGINITVRALERRNQIVIWKKKIV
jgi:hypothetical protein